MQYGNGTPKLKLPEYLQSRWVRIVANEKGYPSFSQFALFVTNEADIVCNPVLCTAKLVCSKCKHQHPTCLHKDVEIWKLSRIESVKASSRVPDATKTNLIMKVGTHPASVMTSMIVHVFLSTTTSEDSMLVYALLDTQSDSSFVLESVANKINAKSEKTRLKLTTMTSTSTITCKKYNNLTIRGFYNNKLITLPTTYSRHAIPVRRSHIPTSDTANIWSHLQTLALKIPMLQDCDIGLLIGYNCSEALKHLKVIGGEDDEPYAVNTHLEWSIVGATTAYEDDKKETITVHVPDELRIGQCHSNKTHFVMKTSCREITNILESDFVERRVEKEVMSQEDIRFMQLMDKETCIDVKGFMKFPCHSTRIV